ncbi:hypothetical protein FCH28_15890 [Streptomyces piniterrae]|uniref:Uncharacterized protein n=1 Tax=Streptomyces piniterrae TaxID=2571125 RepID=A0A4U0NWI3_9ACTN|nr:hypothetical protein [Streptomyces piniterrae]TJZ54574.1 hypothetical protein FCH28_15890 [Streptomyces piniterrae]
MASDSPSGLIDPTTARAALDIVGSARTRVATHIKSPWWYHPGLGASLAFAFSSVSIDWDLIPYGVVLGLMVIPMALTMLLKSSTGVGVDHYTATPGARRLSMVYSLLLGALLALGAVLQWGIDFRWAMAGCGAAAFLLTVVTGLRIERALHRDVQAGA